MNTPERRVPVRYFLQLRDVLLESGVSINRVAQVAGIDEAVFRSRDRFLVGADLDSFMVVAGKLTGRTDLGFELGRRIKMNSHDVLGYGLLSCASIHEFLSMAARHYHLMDETWTLRYRRYFSGGECIYAPCAKMSRGALHFIMEMLAVAHQNHIHLLLGGTEPAYDIHLSMPAPAYVHRFEELAPARFYFHESAAPSVRVVMGPDLLDRTLALSDAEVVRTVDARCSALGKRLQSPSLSCTEQVTMMLREAQGAPPTLKDLAAYFHVSARTMDRQLKKEGWGYRELAEKVRFERACAMLSTASPSIGEVAQQLGFSDAANFSRAFKRVVGVHPSEYQRAPIPL